MFKALKHRLMREERQFCKEPIKGDLDGEFHKETPSGERVANIFWTCQPNGEANKRKTSTLKKMKPYIVADLEGK
jgi:hypothetical protein